MPDEELPLEPSVSTDGTEASAPASDVDDGVAQGDIDSEPNDASSSALPVDGAAEITESPKQVPPSQGGSSEIRAGGPKRVRRGTGGRPVGSGVQRNQGADLERRVGRAEFSDGALVRLRGPIRVDADSGRDVLTDIDVLAVDVDGRLRVTRSILECKSGKGQAGEPDRLLWLSGLQRFLGFERAVLVRQTISKRGRNLARRLGVGMLDVATLSDREASRAWVPETFAHIDGPPCVDAEKRTDLQLKGLAHLPNDLVAFLRHDALRAQPHEALRAVATFGRRVNEGGVLPQPTREVLSGHALVALALAAIIDAGELDRRSLSEVLDRTGTALIAGDPDDDQVLNLLARADELTTLMVRRVHEAYGAAGAARLDLPMPSLHDLVAQRPGWVPSYVDLVERYRANSSVARELLQTIELAVFDALLGGASYKSPAFDHLFSTEHRYLLNATLRCLSEIAGPAIAESLSAVLSLDFSRSTGTRDHDASQA